MPRNRSIRAVVTLLSPVLVSAGLVAVAWAPEGPAVAPAAVSAPLAGSDRAPGLETLFGTGKPPRAHRLGKAPVIVGTRFQVTTPGTVSAVRVWRPRRARATQTVGVWSRGGRQLAAARGTSASLGSGWRTVKLATPLEVVPGRTYVATHVARTGRPMSIRTRHLPSTAGTHLRFASTPGAKVRGDRHRFPAKASGLAFPVTPVFRAAARQEPVVAGVRRGWQVDASTVGLAPLGLTCDALPAYTGPARPPAGTTITRMRITSPIVLDSGSVIEESCVKPTSSWPGLPLVSTVDRDLTSPVTIRDTEIDGSLLPDADSGFNDGFRGVANLQRSYIHDVGSGIAVMNAGSRQSAVIEHNYVARLVAYGDPGGDGNHSDAFTVRDFSAAADPARSLLVQNNRFVCDSGNDTGAVFVQTYSGDIANVTFSGNLLEGEGYQLGLEDGFGNSYSGMSATDNRFSGTGWGPAYVTGNGPGWSEWSENYLANPAHPEFKGRAVRRP